MTRLTSKLTKTHLTLGFQTPNVRRYDRTPKTYPKDQDLAAIWKTGLRLTSISSFTFTTKNLQRLGACYVNGNKTMSPYVLKHVWLLQWNVSKVVFRVHNLRRFNGGGPWAFRAWGMSHGTGCCVEHSPLITHRIHGWYFIYLHFPYFNHKNQPNV